MMTWKKENPYQGKIYQGCANCPPVEQIAEMNMTIAVGFGIATVMCDHIVVYDENHWEGDEYPRLQYFEDMALLKPNHDWRVLLHAPLRSREYQRHDVGKWILIDSGKGFA